MKVSIKNIEAEFNLLKKIHDSPYSYLKGDQKYIEILKTQLSFAKFSDSKLGILPYSVNTHKYYCNKFHILGFEHLNRLRVSAYRKLISLSQHKEKSTKKRNKSLKINKCYNNNLENNNLKLVSILLYLKEKLEEYAFQSENIEIRNDFILVNHQIEKILGCINEE